MQSMTTVNLRLYTLHTLWPQISGNNFLLTISQFRKFLQVTLTALCKQCPPGTDFSYLFFTSGTCKAWRDCTAKRFGLLQLWLWSAQLHSCCVHYIKFRECLQLKSEFSWEIPFFVKLVFLFRKPINQHLWWGLCFKSYTSAPGARSSLIANSSRNAKNVAK